ncbi:ankyrin repeats [Ceratobasidium sp. AG-Ba]|nr:ankyrin repeats [Ceratobasidium sp. AG-Ba]
MRLQGEVTGLLHLPPELLFDILVHSLSHHLPLVNKHIFYTLKHASPFVRAQYILCRHYDTLHQTHGRPSTQSVMDAALSYPMCTMPIIESLERISSPLLTLSSADRKRLGVTPGRWLFRNLPSHTKPKRRKPGRIASTLAPQSPLSDPLTFLEHLSAKYTLVFPEREAALALSTCVRAGPAQYSLLRFLLQAGADPGAKHCFALQVAATFGNMDAMKILIEPSESDVRKQEERAGMTKGGKRRRVEDRVHPTSKVLLAAVKNKHTELAHWLIHEKGVVPDMATMHMLQHM